MRSWGSNANKPVIYPCLPYDDQYWYIRSVPGDPSRWTLQNKASGLCMVLRSWQTYTEGSTCGDYADQKWYYTLMSGA